MKLSYDPTTDMLRISFGERLEVEGFDLCDGIVVHLDAEGEVAGLEIERASERVDLEYLQAIAGDSGALAKPVLKDALLAPEPRTERLVPARREFAGGGPAWTKDGSAEE